MTSTRPNKVQSSVKYPKVPPFIAAQSIEDLKKIYNGDFTGQHIPVNVNINPSSTIHEDDMDKRSSSSTTRHNTFFDGFDLPQTAKRLRTYFERLSRDELGLKAMQAAQASLQYNAGVFDPWKDLDEIMEKLRQKFQHYSYIVSSTVSPLQRLYMNHLKNPISPRLDCCAIPKSDLRLESVYGCKVSRRMSCDLYPRQLSSIAFNPGRNLTQIFSQNMNYWSQVKWFYFISTEGLHTEYPSHQFSPLETTYPWSEQAYFLTPQFANCADVYNYRHRSVYLHSVLWNRPQRVVIILDRGPMSTVQWNLGIRVLSHLLLSLSERDRVHLILNLGGNSIQRARVCTPHLVTRPTQMGKNITFYVTEDFEEPQMSQSMNKAFEKSYPLTEEVKSALLSHVHALTPQGSSSRKGNLNTNSGNSGSSGGNDGWLQVNHSLSLNEAFRLMRSMINEDDVSSVSGYPDYNVIYISRGHSDDLKESERVLELSDHLRHAIHRETKRIVPIHTMLLLSPHDAQDFERAFMLRMSRKEELNKDMSSGGSGSINGQGNGQFYIVQITSDLGQMTNNLWNAVVNSSNYQNSPSTTPPIQFSLPYRDLEGGGLVMSISQTVFHQNKLMGVFGIDVHVADMVDSVTYYSRESLNEERTYAFLMHQDGYVITHPSLQAPSEKPWQVSNPHVTQFEWQPQFRQELLPRILKDKEKRGQATFVWNLDNVNVKESSKAMNNSQEKVTTQYTRNTYYWQWISNDTEKIPFILVLKHIQPFRVDTSGPDDTEYWQPDAIANMKEMNYHRLDFYHRVPSCYFMNDLATFSFSTVFLSARCYEHPFRYLSTQESLANVHHLVVYLTDVSKLLTNPGLKPEVRSHVAAVEKINKFWLHSHQISKYKDYIVRRYISTDLGVVRMYPGTMLNKAYDPTTREWYLKAKKYPDRMVFTGPYLDPGGAGYIVTLSQVLHMEDTEDGASPSESSAPPSGNSKSQRRGIVAVMGIDLTLPFLYQSLRHWMPACDRSSNLRCFLLDESGYLLAHPSFLRAAALSGNQQGVQFSNIKASMLVGNLVNWLQPERNHITHQEPLMSDEFLQQRELVRKISCTSSWSGGSSSGGGSVSSSYSDDSQAGRSGSLPSDWWLANGYLTQRMYRLNMSWSGVASNIQYREDSSPWSEPCTKYQIVHVPDTNLFLGILNESRSGACASRTAFCPCNILDRQCLDCQRMDAQACECPCECPISKKQCMKPSLQPILSAPRRQQSFSQEETLKTPQANVNDDAEEPLCPKPDELDFQLQRSHLMSPFSILSVASRLDATASLQAATSQDGGLSYSTDKQHPSELPPSSGEAKMKQAHNNRNVHILHSQCIQATDCSHRKSRMACVGVVGCTWCELQRERILGYYPNAKRQAPQQPSPGGQSENSAGSSSQQQQQYYHYYLTPLAQPYCTLQEECFGGVKDGQSPYALARNPSLANDPYLRRLGHRVLSPYHYLGGNGMGDFSENSPDNLAEGADYLFYPRQHPHQQDGNGIQRSGNPVFLWQSEKRDEDAYLGRVFHSYSGFPLNGGERMDGSANRLDGMENTTSFSTPFGPIAGGVMACFVFVLLTAYCYRSKLFGHSHHQGDHDIPYQSGLHDGAGMEQLLEDFHKQNGVNNDDDDDDIGGKGGGNGDGGPGAVSVNPLSSEFNELDLDEFECNPTALSPYRVNAGYQRGMCAIGEQGVRPGRHGGPSSVASVGTPSGEGILPECGGGDSSVVTDDDLGYSSVVVGPAPITMNPDVMGIVVEPASARGIDPLQGNTTLRFPLILSRHSKSEVPDVEDTASSAADGGQSVVSEQDSAIGSSVMAPSYDLRRMIMQQQNTGKYPLPLTCPLGAPLSLVPANTPTSQQISVPVQIHREDDSSHVHVVTL